MPVKSMVFSMLYLGMRVRVRGEERRGEERRGEERRGEERRGEERRGEERRRWVWVINNLNLYSCSGLESALKISEGKREVGHFESKDQVQGSLSPLVTRTQIFPPPSPSHFTHNMIEYLMKSGVPYTIVQPSAYYEVCDTISSHLLFYFLSTCY